MAVFRFLVNVDKCLDMSHYKCFFYKLKSSGSGKRCLFHHSEAQLLAGDPLSFRNAVADIRMYLDKYPYEVEDYRIIFLMRGSYTDAAQNWEETMLCRLLRLRYEFQRARILLSSSLDSQRDNALNLVMLYDADFSASLPSLAPYFTSKRFSKDMQMLMEKYGIPDDQQGISRISDQLEATRLTKDGKTSDAYAAPAEADFLRQYLAVRKESDESIGGTETTGEMLTGFAKDLFANYRVYERFINRSDRRDETLSFLRLTDFINHDTDAAHNGAVSTLAQRCDAAWDGIWSDPDTKTRFANMLAAYRSRLIFAENLLEKPVLPPEAETTFPKKEIPGEKAIASKLSNFEAGSKERKRREDVLLKLENYKKRDFFKKSFREDWNKTCREITEILNDLKGTLRLYAQDLSNQYVDILSNRKKETAGWKNLGYAADTKEKEQLAIIAKEKEEVLRALKDPHMNPAMSFQDVLNSEQQLEKHSKDISFYLDCIRQTTFLNFLLLLLVCCGLFALHYTLLQPYVLSEFPSLLCYLIYIGAAFVMMGTTFAVPYRYYSKCAFDSMEKLAQALKNSIDGYYKRAAYFSQYMNQINRLDYITRFYDLYERALKHGHTLKTGQLWHRDQIRKHIEMLDFFEGLMESATDGEDGSTGVTSVLAGGQLCDVEDCPVYWPQGQ